MRGTTTQGCANARKTRIGFTLGWYVEPGPLQLAFFITAYKDDIAPVNPWRRVSSLLWQRYAQPLVARGEPGRVPMDVYVKHTYDWAFDSWAHSVWQEFQLDGKRAGAPQFIVNVSPETF